MNNSWQGKVAKAESQLKEAMISSDIIMLDELLSENLVFTNHLGQVMTKSDDIEGHKGGDLKIADIVLSDQIMKPIDKIGPNSILVSVCAEISGSYKGSPANGSFRFTRVWAKEDGAWRVVIGHSSIVA